MLGGRIAALLNFFLSVHSERRMRLGAPRDVSHSAAVRMNVHPTWWVDLVRYLVSRCKT